MAARQRQVQAHPRHPRRGDEVAAIPGQEEIRPLPRLRFRQPTQVDRGRRHRILRCCPTQTQDEGRRQRSYRNHRRR